MYEFFGFYFGWCVDSVAGPSPTRVQCSSEKEEIRYHRVIRHLNTLISKAYRVYGKVEAISWMV